MKKLSVFVTQSSFDRKFCPVFSWLHCKDHLNLEYNFFGRIFVVFSMSSTLFEMQIIQRLTSRCIKSVYEIALFFMNFNLNVDKLWLISRFPHLSLIVWQILNTNEQFKSHYPLWCHPLYIVLAYSKSNILTKNWVTNIVLETLYCDIKWFWQWNQENTGKHFVS